MSMSSLTSSSRPAFFFSSSGDHRDLHLSLHDALPIFGPDAVREAFAAGETAFAENYIQEGVDKSASRADRKSTRLNSSHRCISYAVFCLKKKKDRLR